MGSLRMGPVVAATAALLSLVGCSLLIQQHKSLLALGMAPPRSSTATPLSVQHGTMPVVSWANPFLSQSTSTRCGMDVVGGPVALSSHRSSGILPTTHNRLRRSLSLEARGSSKNMEVVESVEAEEETAFWDWVEGQGIVASDRLRLAKFNGVVGLQVATRDQTRSGQPGGGGLRPGDVILEIPREAILSTIAFQNSYLGQKLGPEQIKLISAKVQLALVLLQAQIGLVKESDQVSIIEGKNNLRPWISLVEDSVAPRPCNWSMMEIERTQNPKLMTLFGALKTLRRSQLDRVQPIIRGIGGQRVDEKDFDWAMTEVDRRSILLPSSDKDKPQDGRSMSLAATVSAEHLIAPVLDLMQPDPLAQCAVEVDEQTQAIKVIANEHVPGGKRVQFRPPPPGIPNEVFLTSHGYIPEINTNDFIVLRGIMSEKEWRGLLMKVDTGDAEAAQKFQLLKIFHDDNYSISAFTLPSRLLLALRIFHLNPKSPKQNLGFEELKAMIQEDRNQFFSVQNEAKVAQSLLDVADELLKKYPTSLEEDVKMLKEGPLNEDQRLAIQYRRSKKSLLHQMKLRMESYLEQAQTRRAGLGGQAVPLERFILQPVRMV